jgi:two-component system chemotaxis response regulator CheB
MGIGLLPDPLPTAHCPLPTRQRGRVTRQHDPAALPILLLTPSPLLRAEIKGLIGGGAARGLDLQLHVSEARERELASVMPGIAPRVVLVPFDPGDGRGLEQARELRLIEQLVQGWRVPTLVLGLRQDRDAAIETAVEAACRAVGAVGYLPRDRWMGDGGAGLRAKIGAAARVKVLRPIESSRPAEPLPATRELSQPEIPPPVGWRRLHEGPGPIIVVGASAGGPAALREFLGALPVALSAPVLIVQHLPPTFGEALALDLSRFTPFGVTVAAIGDVLSPGRVLLAPGRQALTIAQGQVVAMADSEVGGIHGQAIDRTMESVAATYGAGAIGVILSGMGEDGVRGLQAIKARDGMTFGQDEASCQVYGMPRRAAELGLLDRTGPPAKLGLVIGQLFKRPTPAPEEGMPVAEAERESVRL